MSRESVERHRTPLILVAGLDGATTTRAAHALLAARTVLIDYTCAGGAAGVGLQRILTWMDSQGLRRRRVDEIAAVPGHLACALSLDVLSLLRRLHRWENVDTIVYRLTPTLEPEAVAVAIDDMVVADLPGFIDAPAGADVQIAATLTCVDESRWLADATGELTIDEAEVLDVTCDPDDGRTLAQVAVGQVAFADALILCAADGSARPTPFPDKARCPEKMVAPEMVAPEVVSPDAWEQARSRAVLARLAPTAPVLVAGQGSDGVPGPITAAGLARLLAVIPEGSRRGRIDAPWDPLLVGQPPLTPDCGVQLVEFAADRPFHPERLHDALDVLLDGVVQARGRIWLATRPEEMLFLESAGEALGISAAGRWLAAGSAQDFDTAAPHRRALAALCWHPEHGDRHSSLVALVHRGDPDALRAALSAACLTDEELRDGQDLWMAYPDPFGLAHSEPCDDMADRAARLLSGAQNPAHPDISVPITEEDDR